MRSLTGCLILLLAACANEPRTITAQEGGGRVSVDHGDRLVIPLPEQPGFEWAMREPVSRTVMLEAPPSDNTRRFTPVVSGIETLRFEQRKPGSEAVERTVTYEVVVP